MKAAKTYGNLAPHPTVDGWVSGWAVLSNTLTNWHLAAVYECRQSAEKEAAQLGGSYQAVFGYHRPGTADFLHKHEVDCSTLPILA
jgi:hypothetical protein